MKKPLKIQMKSAKAANALEDGKSCWIYLDLTEDCLSKTKIKQKNFLKHKVKKEIGDSICCNCALYNCNCTGVDCIPNDFILRKVEK